MGKLGQDLLDDPVDWGRLLIETHDHDPLYSGLLKWEKPGARKRRFLLAYWCCYSVGASWYISQQSGSRFWDLLYKAAENNEPCPTGERWPRAHERRHWRALNATSCVADLRARYKYPEEAVRELEQCRTLAEVTKAATQWTQFGPWIAFKAADMIERVLGVEVEFTSSIIDLYADPRKGAEMAAELWEMSGPEEAVDHLLRSLGDMPAPGGGRPVGIQEVETVLCKWKSARGGRYYIGADTHDHRIELEKWGAQDLLASYPTIPA